MSNRIRFLDHSIHAIMTDFPIALWLTSILWDILRIFNGDVLWSIMAFWTLLVGSIFGFLSIISGLLEYATIQGNHPSIKTATWHMIIMLLASGLFIASFIIHRNPTLLTTHKIHLALALSAIGALMLFVGGWLGGDLIFRYGVGTRFFRNTPQPT